MSKHNICVPYIDQTEKWPTGCESVSAVMLLNYLGIEVSVDEFVAKYLPLREFCEKDGVRYGANPREEFVGSPYDADSFGCYAPVICGALNRVFKDFGSSYTAYDVTGADTQELCRYLDANMPVVYWATLDLKEPVIGPEWVLYDSGKTFTWISNEHCMLLTGYDEDKLYFNDPWHNHGNIPYDKELIKKRHMEQYGMAVAVQRI